LYLYISVNSPEATDVLPYFTVDSRPFGYDPDPNGSVS
jgi:hypothetical protein